MMTIQEINRRADEHGDCYEAIAMLGAARWRTEGELYDQLTRIMNYLRDSAHECIYGKAKPLPENPYRVKYGRGR